VTLSDAIARAREARVGRMATVTGEGGPHVVPFVFVLVGEGSDLRAFWAVDRKPKRGPRLKRIENLAANPALEFVVMATTRTGIGSGGFASRERHGWSPPRRSGRRPSRRSRRSTPATWSRLRPARSSPSTSTGSQVGRPPRLPQCPEPRGSHKEPLRHDPGAPPAHVSGSSERLSEICYVEPPGTKIRSELVVRCPQPLFRLLLRRDVHPSLPAT
jgi:hypothetical protein